MCFPDWPPPGHNQPADLVCSVIEEVGMKRVLSLFLGVLLLAAPGFAQAAKGKAEKAAKPAAGKTLSAMGQVTAVAADSVAVKGKAGEWTFAVDKDTTVV